MFLLVSIIKYMKVTYSKDKFYFKFIPIFSTVSTVTTVLDRPMFNEAEVAGPFLYGCIVRKLYLHFSYSIILSDDISLINSFLLFRFT